MLYTCPKCLRDNLLSDEVILKYRISLGKFAAVHCKICHKNKAKEYRLKNPDSSRASVKKYKSRNEDKVKNQILIKKYGISLDRYNEMLRLQNNGCAICKLPCNSGDQLSVDHNHITNEVRALLCKKCNLLVSNCKENEDIIWNLLEYIKKYNLKISA